MCDLYLHYVYTVHREQGEQNTLLISNPLFKGGETATSKVHGHSLSELYSDLEYIV